MVRREVRVPFFRRRFSGAWFDISSSVPDTPGLLQMFATLIFNIARSGSELELESGSMANIWTQGQCNRITKVVPSLIEAVVAVVGNSSQWIALAWQVSSEGLRKPRKFQPTASQVLETPEIHCGPHSATLSR